MTYLVDCLKTQETRDKKKKGSEKSRSGEKSISWHRTSGRLLRGTCPQMAEFGLNNFGEFIEKGALALLEHSVALVATLHYASRAVHLNCCNC